MHGLDLLVEPWRPVKVGVVAQAHAAVLLIGDSREPFQPRALMYTIELPPDARLDEIELNAMIGAHPA